MNFKFELGDELKCKVTGFTGIVMAKTEWLNGCRRYALQSAKLKDGKVADLEHIDEQQLELVKAKKVSVGKVESGGPFPAARGMSAAR